ncbi:MAG: helix-turn-helix transcriptional regulator [Clostridia bacterium]|nr:helix-turn-helix transcriptional regulator [Clostridia bacterium]
MSRIRIRELRKQRRVPQRELGDYMGVGQSTVSAWERGLRSPEVEQLQRLSEFFEVSVDYLLGLDAGYANPGWSGGPAASAGVPGLEAEELEKRLPDSIDISPEGIVELCRFYEYVKNTYPAHH